MRNYLFSFSTFLILFLSASTGSLENYDTSNAASADLDFNTMAIEDDLTSCNLTFSYSQIFSECNTNTNGCAAVNMNISGLYGYGCQGNVTDIWFESMFLCSQGQWSGTSPSIKIKLDLIAAFVGSSTVYIPVTMKWTYNCGSGTCTGSYSKTVKMTIC